MVGRRASGARVEEHAKDVRANAVALLTRGKKYFHLPVPLRSLFQRPRSTTERLQAIYHRFYLTARTALHEQSARPHHHTEPHQRQGSLPGDASNSFGSVSILGDRGFRYSQGRPQHRLLYLCGSTSHLETEIRGRGGDNWRTAGRHRAAGTRAWIDIVWGLQVPYGCHRRAWAGGGLCRPLDHTWIVASGRARRSIPHREVTRYNFGSRILACGAFTR